MTKIYVRCNTEILDNELYGAHFNQYMHLNLIPPFSIYLNTLNPPF